MLRTEHQSARMTKIKNGGLDQYGAEPLESSNLEQLALNRVNEHASNEQSQNHFTVHSTRKHKEPEDVLKSANH